MLSERALIFLCSTSCSQGVVIYSEKGRHCPKPEPPSSAMKCCDQPQAGHTHQLGGGIATGARDDRVQEPRIQGQEQACSQSRRPSTMQWGASRGNPCPEKGQRCQHSGQDQAQREQLGERRGELHQGQCHPPQGIPALGIGGMGKMGPGSGEGGQVGSEAVASHGTVVDETKPRAPGESPERERSGSQKHRGIQLEARVGSRSHLS